jgi:hypothetical protein
MSLNNEIKAINKVLIKYGETKWKLPPVNSRKDASRVLSMFGGMGSINDLYICKINGHRIEKSQESTVNNELQDHLTEVHKGCVDLIAKN